MDRAHGHSYCSIRACIPPLPYPCLTSSSPGLCLLPLSSGDLSSTSSLPVHPSRHLALLTPGSFPLSNSVMLPGTFLPSGVIDLSLPSLDLVHIFLSLSLSVFLCLYLCLSLFLFVAAFILFTESERELLWPFSFSFSSVGRLKLTKFGTSKQAEGKRGFSESLGRKGKGCGVDHALWWVINCLYDCVSLLINCA